jgi:hypothetical protein
MALATLNTLPKVALIDGSRTDGLIVAIVGSFSTKGVKYAVGMDQTGRIACTCPSYTFSRGVKTCKHCRTFEENLRGEAK